MDKVKVKTFNCLRYSDFDEMVNTLFFPNVEDNKKFYVQADLETGNMVAHTFYNITKKDWVEIRDMDAWDYQRWKKFINNEYVLGMTVVLLEFFVAKKVLPEGNYMIEFNY